MAVTDEEFRALQQQMQQQSDQIQDLQKARQEDKQEIQKLKDQLGVTQKTTDDTQKKVEETQKKVEETQQTATAAAEAAAKVQPVHPVPSEGLLATHNVSLVGDAEVQFVKPEGQHGAFLLADFAPIFLYRAGDNVLFEAGFDIGLHNNFDSNGNRQARKFDVGGLEFCDTGLFVQRLRHARGRGHVVAARHVHGTRCGMAQQDSR